MRHVVQTVPLRRSLILGSVPAAMLSLGSQQAGVPLRLKSFVLRQVTQALAYLHSQNSPLIHHDLSPNNVLLNMVSFVAKLTDLGVSRAINPSAISRKSSINGTPAFTSSEALHPHPLPLPMLQCEARRIWQHLVISHSTKESPHCTPCMDSFQHCKFCIEMFTVQEKQLFLLLLFLCTCILFIKPCLHLDIFS